MRTGHIPKRMNSKFDRDKNEYDETNFIYIAGNYAFKFPVMMMKVITIIMISTR